MNLLRILPRNLISDLKDTVVAQHCSGSASESLTPEYTFKSTIFFLFLINGQDENTSTQHLEVINHANFKLDRNCLSLPEQTKQSKNSVIY